MADTRQQLLRCFLQRKERRGVKENKYQNNFSIKGQKHWYKAGQKRLQKPTQSYSVIRAVTTLPSFSQAAKPTEHNSALLKLDSKCESRCVAQTDSHNCRLRASHKSLSQSSVAICVPIPATKILTYQESKGHNDQNHKDRRGGTIR